MKTTAREALSFVKENDVTFVKLSFCDLMGRHKNLSILSEWLPEAFAHGVEFDASGVCGFGGERRLFLRPDAVTLSVLPWRPQQGRVARLFCDVLTPDLAPFACDSRRVLKDTVEELRGFGVSAGIAGSCEFYLFERDEHAAPTLAPNDFAGYCDAAPLDRAENVRRDVCLALREMDVLPRNSHHARGPGQNAVEFTAHEPLLAADGMVDFRSTVRSIAALNGLYASFMPSPLAGKPGSGYTVALVLSREGENITGTARPGGQDTASAFLAGVLQYAPDMALFTNPLTNSYTRLEAVESPGFAAWGDCARAALQAGGEGPMASVRLRTPDPAANPYLLFALLLKAGMAGIREALALPPRAESDAAARAFCRLPQNLGEAIERAQESGFLRQALPGCLLERFLSFKRTEWEQYLAAQDRAGWEHKTYFLQT